MLLLIPIPAIRELAIAATIGVCVLLFTNLVLLPVILSITGVSTRAAARSLKQEEQGAGTKGVWEFFNRFAERRSWAAAAILIAVVLGIGGHVVSRKLQIGDLDPGAPELRAHSRYNIDNAFITANFALSSDVFAVIIKTPVEQCMRYATLQQADQLAWPLQQLPEIQATVSLADSVEQVTAGTYEGSAKWYTLSRNQEVLNYGAQQAIQNTPDLTNAECSVMPVIALGVGIGVDYALYLLSVQLHGQRRGMPLAEAYRAALSFTGRIVALVGLTLAAGVITWAWSPIKFQADMGILLAFMFLWNMLGALILIPALSRFLLPTSAVYKSPEPA